MTTEIRKEEIGNVKADNKHIRKSLSRKDRKVKTTESKR